MNKPLIIVSLLILIFTTIGCDKDDFVQGSPVIEAKQDSLSCKMWLHNIKGDTTNVFREGEDIRIGLFLQSSKKEDVWIYKNDNLTPNILIYRSDDNYLGYPFSGPTPDIAIFKLLTNKKPVERFFNISGLDNGKKIPKGEYYVIIKYSPTLYRGNSLRVDETAPQGTVDFPQMRINFKIQ